MGIANLDKLFAPRGVAVIGASETEGSVGRALILNMLESGYKGRVFPVNDHRTEVFGRRCWPSIGAVGEPVDLAVIATPIAMVPMVTAQCREVGAGAAIVISAGGKETGSQGRELEERIRREAGDEMRILGPNCLGLIRPAARLNASFAAAMPHEGNLAFLSQSGAICTAILDYSLGESIGYSHFVSLGSMLDIDFGDLIDYLGFQADVRAILIYAESITHPRKFMSAARSVARTKPIIILKAGRSQAGARAAATHTGAMASEDAVYDAAFMRAGLVRVGSIGELFNCAELLAKQPRPAGKRLGIITNAGGPGVMAADAMSERGMAPAVLEPATLARLDELLPPAWSHSNPVDILGDASAERYCAALEVLQSASEIDGILVILTPQAVTKPEQVAEALRRFSRAQGKPIITCWMGGVSVEAARRTLSQASIPCYQNPEEAIGAFGHLYQHARNQEMLLEIPPRLSSSPLFDRAAAREVVEPILAAGGGSLSEASAKRLLGAYGIPVLSTETAATAQEAAAMAERLGGEVALKIDSPDILHKSEAGGVLLGLYGPEAVARGFERIMAAARAHDPRAQLRGVTVQPMAALPDYELLLGAKTDDVFGPVIIFGMGGVFTEVWRDLNMGLPPLNRVLVRRLMEGTRAGGLLDGFRNRPPANMAELEDIVVRLSQLVTDFPEVREIEMNPLAVSNGRALALDARAVVAPAAVASPRHLVISPYPTGLERQVSLPDGLELLLRPVRPEDADLFVELFEDLSPSTIYLRFFSPLRQVPREFLARYTQIDYDREVAIVATVGVNGRDRMLGVARAIGDPDGQKAEFSILVADPWQGRGVGAALMQACIEVCRQQGYHRLHGMVLRENVRMLALARKCDFTVSRSEDVGEYLVEADLTV